MNRDQGAPDPGPYWHIFDGKTCIKEEGPNFYELFVRGGSVNKKKVHVEFKPKFKDLYDDGIWKTQFIFTWKDQVEPDPSLTNSVTAESNEGELKTAILSFCYLSPEGYDVHELYDLVSLYFTSGIEFYDANQSRVYTFGHFTVDQVDSISYNWANPQDHCAIPRWDVCTFCHKVYFTNNNNEAGTIQRVNTPGTPDRDWFWAKYSGSGTRIKVNPWTYDEDRTSLRVNCQYDFMVCGNPNYIDDPSLTALENLEYKIKPNDGYRATGIYFDDVSGLEEFSGDNWNYKGISPYNPYTRATRSACAISPIWSDKRQIVDVTLHYFDPNDTPSKTLYIDDNLYATSPAITYNGYPWNAVENVFTNHPTFGQCVPSSDNPIWTQKVFGGYYFCDSQTLSTDISKDYVFQIFDENGFPNQNNLRRLSNAAYNGSYSKLKLFINWLPGVKINYYDKDGMPFSGTFQDKYPLVYDNKQVDLFTPHKKGHLFFGWHYSSDCSDEPITSIEASKGLDSPINLYADWDDNESPVYTITYKDVGGGDLTGFTYGYCPNFYTKGESFELGKCTKDVFEFEGWYISIDAQGEPVTDITNSFTGNIILYAKWSSIGDIYTIDVDPGPDATAGIDKIYFFYYDNNPDYANFQGYYYDKERRTKFIAGNIMSQIYLPTPTKDNIWFNGYFGNISGDPNPVMMTDYSGKITSNVNTAPFALDKVPTPEDFEGKWTVNWADREDLDIIEVNLDANLGDDIGTPGVDKYYNSIGDEGPHQGYYYDRELTKPIVKQDPVAWWVQPGFKYTELPTKVGYTFMGYYGVGFGYFNQYINSAGEFNYDAHYSRVDNLKATWALPEPIELTINIDWNSGQEYYMNDGKTKVEKLYVNVGQIVNKDVGIYWDENLVDKFDINSALPCPTWSSEHKICTGIFADDGEYGDLPIMLPMTTSFSTSKVPLNNALKFNLSDIMQIAYFSPKGCTLTPHWEDPINEFTDSKCHIVNVDNDLSSTFPDADFQDLLDNFWFCPYYPIHGCYHAKDDGSIDWSKPIADNRLDKIPTDNSDEKLLFYGYFKEDNVIISPQGLVNLEGFYDVDSISIKVAPADALQNKRTIKFKLDGYSEDYDYNFDDCPEQLTIIGSNQEYKLFAGIYGSEDLDNYCFNNTLPNVPYIKDVKDEKAVDILAFNGWTYQDGDTTKWLFTRNGKFSVGFGDETLPPDGTELTANWKRANILTFDNPIYPDKYYFMNNLNNAGLGVDASDRRNNVDLFYDPQMREPVSNIWDPTQEKFIGFIQPLPKLDQYIFRAYTLTIWGGNYYNTNFWCVYGVPDSGSNMLYGQVNTSALINLDYGISVDTDLVGYSYYVSDNFLIDFDLNYENAGQILPKIQVYNTFYNLYLNYDFVVQREGYYFEGWWTQPEGGDLITKDNIVQTFDRHTLYAHWRPSNGYTIYADANSGYFKDTFSPPSLFVKPGETVYTSDLPKPVRDDNFVCVGWINSDNFDTGILITDISEDNIDFVGCVKGNTNLTGKVYAIWGLKVESTFDADGGKWLDESTQQNIDQIYNENYVLPKDNPAKTGYKFDGWFSDKTYETEITPSTIVTNSEAHTIYVKWTAKSDIKATFNANGGKWSDDSITQDISQTYNDLYKFPTNEPTRIGYEFDGWYTDNTSYETKIDETTKVQNEEAHNIYAKWNAKTDIKVTFDANDGFWEGDVGTQEINQTFDDFYKFPSPIPTRTSYIFVGWYTDNTTYETQIVESTRVQNELEHTIYAKWEAVPFTIFNPNGGTGGPEKMTLKYGQDISSIQLSPLPVFVQDAITWNFQGYYDNEDSKTKYFDKQGRGQGIWDKVAGCTLYAHWWYADEQLSLSFPFGKTLGEAVSNGPLEGNIYQDGDITTPLQGDIIFSDPDKMYTYVQTHSGTDVFEDAQFLVTTEGPLKDEKLPIRIKIIVEQKDVTVSGITAKNTIYNGTNIADLDTSVVDIDGAIEGYEVGIDSLSGEYDNADVGENKTITLNYALNNLNYKLSESSQKTTKASILAKNITDEMITIFPTSFLHDGLSHIPDVVVKNGDKILIEGVDYLLNVPESAIEVGTYTLTITGLGNYNSSFQASKNWSINNKYSILEGGDLEHVKGAESDIKIKCDAQSMFLDFIMVDGQIIKTSNYIIFGEPLSVQLLSSYLDTLSVGKHELRLVFTDGGLITTYFTIKNAQIEPGPLPDSNLPNDLVFGAAQTPDVNFNLCFLLVTLQLFIVFIYIVLRKKPGLL